MKAQMPLRRPVVRYRFDVKDQVGRRWLCRGCCDPAAGFDGSLARGVVVADGKDEKVDTNRAGAQVDVCVVEGAARELINPWRVAGVEVCKVEVHVRSDELRRVATALGKLPARRGRQSSVISSPFNAHRRFSRLLQTATPFLGSLRDWHRVHATVGGSRPVVLSMARAVLITARKTQHAASMRGCNWSSG